MESDWAVACATDDPVVVVPWASADGSLRFVDLRKNLQAIDEIEEARWSPAIAAALRGWNVTNGPIFTVKCDVWKYPAKLFDAFDRSGFAHAHASYIDLVPVDPEVYRSFPSCEKLLRQGNEAARSIDVSDSRCEWMLRPAQIFDLDRDNAAHGFAISLYVWGYGETVEYAEAKWSAALLALIEPVTRVMAHL